MEALHFVLLLFLLFGTTLTLDLHLDGTDSGFFFQQSLGSSQQPLLKSPAQHQANVTRPEHRPLLRERLAVLGPSAHPGRVVVSYGPFEAKQSLPSKYLAVPPDNSTDPGASDQSMDISAHIVSGELRRESPVLRVLFHSGRHFHSADHPEDEPDSRPTGDDWDEHESGSRLMETCIALRVQNPNGAGHLTSTCSPKGLDGVCLASITLPFDWWTSSPISPTFPSLSTSLLGLQPQLVPTVKPSRAVRNAAELSYSVYETKAGQCNADGRKSFQQHQQQQQRTPTSFPPASAVLIQPARSIGSVKLLPNAYAPRDLLVHEEAVTLSPTLRFIASAAPLYPQSYFYVTVVLDSAKDEPYAVVVRAKVKHGLRIVSSQTTNPAWSLSFDVNGKHIAAAVTAVRNFSVSTQSSSQELFTWLLAVNLDQHRDAVELSEGVRALWSWTIRTHSSSSGSVGSGGVGGVNKEGMDEVKGKLTSRFEVLKDEVQSVFTIIKRRDLVNTAVLTARQVSEPLRVFMVTQAGKVADVTLQASCSSSDESVLKVTSSCSSVYLDGSEVRGSTNATLVARYGNVESTSSLTVWVPEMPLDIQLDDVKLNQINGWKVAANPATPATAGSCRLRYQQTPFEVFARFYAEDHDSGRVSYLISRKTYLLVTDLVRKFARVSDPRVASLKSGTGLVEGLKPGKTELQVLSPMSGHVIGTREIRVVADRVDVTGLSVRLVAGLSLNLTPDPDLESCYVAQVDASDRLHSKYQEAILDLTVHFSDGTLAPLRLTDRSHYNLAIDSYNASILTLTSPAKANIPRVLALGEGRAALSVTFSSTCPQEEGAVQSTSAAHPLGSTVLQVAVSLTGSPAATVQNDARTESHTYTLPAHGFDNQIIGEAGKRNAGRIAAVSAAAAGRTLQPNPGQLTFSKPGSTEFGANENQLSLKDDALVMSGGGGGGGGGRMHPGDGHVPHHPAFASHHPGIAGSSIHWQTTPLEIGMYVLLAIFCAAIVVFVGTCFVYASRARKGLIPADDPAAPDDDHPMAPTPASARSIWSRLKRKDDPEDGAECADELEEEGADKGWVWLGRSTLDSDAPLPPPPPPPPRPASNVVEYRASRSEASSSSSSSNAANRMSGISYSGSEVSVRIVTKPGSENGRLSYQAELCFEPLDDLEADERWSEAGSSVDSKTFTKPVRITANQLANATAAAADEPLLSNVVRRPKSGAGRSARRSSEQDTRRYARSWLMAGEAVPRDFNSNPSTLNNVTEPKSETDDELAAIDAAADDDDVTKVATTPDGYNLATFLRHGSLDIKQANIVENPRFSAASPTSQLIECHVKDDASKIDDVPQQNDVDDDSKNLEQVAVDYDKIISYLGILKETSA